MIDALNGPPPPTDHRWSRRAFVVREKRLTLGRQYHVLDAENRPLAYCKQKMFRLKEDIRFYADESQERELFRLEAAKVLDFSGSFFVIDSGTGRRLGRLQRKGWKSLLRDEWLLFDADDRPWGRALEDSPWLAGARRVLDLVTEFFGGSIIPSKYFVVRERDGAPREVAWVAERFQLFGDTYDVRIDAASDLDSRVLVGLAVCLDAIEGE